MKRHLLRIGTLAALGVGLIGATSWQAFDVLFKRSEGWNFSDGVPTALLPPQTGSTGGRVLWAFGDTSVWTGGHVQPGASLENGLEGDALLLGGNTYAISPWASSPTEIPSASNMRFFARRGAPCQYGNSSCTCGATPALWAQNCPVQEITHASQVPSDFSRLRGMIPPIADQNINWASNPLFVGDAHYPATDPFTGAPYVIPAAFAAFPTPPKFVAEAYTPGTFPNPNGSAYPAFYANYMMVATGLENGDPSTWAFTNSQIKDTNHNVAVNPGDANMYNLQWGVAMVHVPGDDKIRIYGSRQALNDNRQNRSGAIGADAVLAVAWPPTDIVDYTRWYFAYTDFGVTHPCQDLHLPSPCFGRRPPYTPTLVQALTHVAQDVASEYSVDYITHTEPGVNGHASVTASRFVMVHGSNYNTTNHLGGPLDSGGNFTADDPFVPNARVLVMRTTLDDTAWPPQVNGTYTSPYGPVSTVVDDAIATPSWDKAMLSGINGGRMVHAVKGHGDLSPDGTMLVSWVIDQDAYKLDTVDLWQSPPPTQNETNRKSPVRFAKYWLKAFQPWCAAVGSCP